MKKLIWADANGVRTFGCAACKWTHEVKEFNPESSEMETPDGFDDHNCDHPSWKFDADQSSALAGSCASPAPKRRWRRYDFHVPVAISLGARRIQVLGTALNEGGMTVCSETTLRIGEEMKVEFRPPFSNTVVNLGAVVRNRSGNRYGLEFTGATDAERLEIVLLRSMVKMLEARVTYYEERASSKVLY
jgi:hypothetical protein